MNDFTNLLTAHRYHTIATPSGDGLHIARRA